MSTTTETAPDSCPFCGAGVIIMEDGSECRSMSRWVTFQCFTNWHPNFWDPRVGRSFECMTAERERLTRERDELRAWKESAMAVEREWDANAIATALGGMPGESQRAVIAREVPRLLERIETLENEKMELQKQNQQFGDNAFENALSLVNHRNQLQEENADLLARAKRLEKDWDAWPDLQREWFGDKYAAMQPMEAVRARIEDSEARIKRLEEALDRIIEIRNSATGAGQYLTLDLIESVATKAKEAKP